MALVGGGGAGNVAGSNPAGTGSTINYIRTKERNFAYAYSGVISVANTETTLLSFTTGNETVVSKITVSSNAGENEDYRMKIIVDGQTVYSNLT